MEARRGTKVKKDAEVKAEGRDVAAELPAGAFGKTFSRLQFDDNSPFNQHVDALKADLLTTEGHDEWVLAINSKPSTAQRDLQSSRIERLDEPVAQLVIHLEEAPHDRVAELLLDDDGTGKPSRSIRVIRVHSGNSGSAGRDPVTQIAQPRADCPEIREEFFSGQPPAESS